MTTANKITLARIALVPVCVVLMLLDFRGHKLAALLVFAVAAISDCVDGQVARRFGQVTDFGKFADPLADKILVVCALLVFVQWGQIPAWCVCVVVTREFAVTGLRLVAAEKGTVIAAGRSGKLKTLVSDVGICVLLTPWQGLALGGVSWLTLNNAFVALIVLLTLWSGVEYFAKNASVIRNMK